ncbi:dynamin family protein [Campylobacter mucosalis]|uniref:dynamin family protein n=1 Tax=Campylobacter mucosalis TaxID=202 RepID=UPI0014707AEF|nr:dynamin family protein [Campylobacter mucosalis]
MNKFLSEIWDEPKLFLDTKTTIITDEQLLAIIMATNIKNYDRFIALNEFRDILYKLNLRADLFSVQTAQVGTINAIKQSKISKTTLLKSLKLINENNIITASELENLENFINSLEQTELKTEQINTKRHYFQERSKMLDELYLRLLSICDEQNKTRLHTQKQKLDELKFNVAATGVINAGKSTMLNALLNKQILGTSNVPETTNLTLLKYSHTPFAKINFWSNAELKELGIDAQTNEQSPKKIEISELKNYTSATSDISKMVKSVELYEDLEILKDGVCIVDTPGIDDAVFLREQVVSDFMSECDLMIHLMNVSQSSTQKDFEFILHSFLNNHIVKLAIVLTHSDLLTPNELNDVISYTQKSIKDKLNSIKDIDIFAISAKEYFKNPQNGGVGELKEYLYKTLFGDDSKKAHLAIDAYKKELLSVCKNLLEQKNSQVLALSGSNLEINEKISSLQNEQNELLKLIDDITKQSKDELKQIDANAIDTSFKLSLALLSSSIKDRLLNEIEYHKKQGKKPNDISYIVKTALNDGILNIARVKRNEILSAINGCKERLLLKFKELEIKSEDEIFNIGEYLKSVGINFNYEQVCHAINDAISKDTKTLEQSIQGHLEQFLSDEKLGKFTSLILNLEKDKFTNLINEKLTQKLNELKQSEQTLSQKNLALSQTNKQIRSNLKSLTDEICELESVLTELKNA